MLSLLVCPIVQGTDTSPAGWVVFYVERLPELLSCFSIDDLCQRGGGYVSYRAMKEAGTDGTVDFYYGGDPGGIADWGLGRELAEMFTKTTSDPSKFSGGLDDVLVIDAVLVFEDKAFDLLFQFLGFFDVQTDLTLLFAGPYQGAVERR